MSWVSSLLMHLPLKLDCSRLLVFSRAPETFHITPGSVAESGKQRYAGKCKAPSSLFDDDLKLENPVGLEAKGKDRL